MANNSRETARGPRSAFRRNPNPMSTVHHENVLVQDNPNVEESDCQISFLEIFADERLFSAGYHERPLGFETAKIAG